MPELAEVEHFRRCWNPGLGCRIVGVEAHWEARPLRGIDPERFESLWVGRSLVASEARAKQMLFRGKSEGFLGVHLGMTGRLSWQGADHAPGKWDHLVLRTSRGSLVFSDPRQFGRIRSESEPGEPEWWTGLPPDLLSEAFTLEALSAYLQRRGKAPIKAVLLQQERFPGIGNWMADEILWRSRLHPAEPAGRLPSSRIKVLYREIRWVCREALRIIAPAFEDPPSDWLFPHRWEDGGHCPVTGRPLVRETIGGRTTCWSPARQKRLRRSGADGGSQNSSEARTKKVRGSRGP